MKGFDFGSIMGGAMSAVSGLGGAGSKYGTVAVGLSIGGGVLKSLDDDNSGVDDLAAEFCFTGAKVLQAIEGGQAQGAVLAIDASIEALQAIRSQFEEVQKDA